MIVSRLNGYKDKARKSEGRVIDHQAAIPYLYVPLGWGFVSPKRGVTARLKICPGHTEVEQIFPVSLLGTEPCPSAH